MSFTGVILAAGRSRRAGVFKPAVVHRGRSLLGHAVDGMVPWCRRVVVVAGYRQEEVAGLVAGRDRVAVVANPDPDRGMFSSVQVGIRAAGEEGEGVFVLPADCPLVEGAVYERLIAAFRDHGADRAVIPVHLGRGGHPVLLPPAIGGIILAAAPTSNLREILRGARAARVDVDQPSVLLDLDTAADLDALADDGNLSEGI